MPDQGTVGAKRLRLSRNKKKTWRKLARDVDDLLPEQSKLEVAKRRSGGFFIDVGGSEQKKPAAGQLAGLRCHSNLLDDVTQPQVSKRLKKFNERQLAKRARGLASGEQQKAKELSTDPYDLWDPEGESRAYQLPSDKAEQELLDHHLRTTRQRPVLRRARPTKAELPSCLVPKSGASYNPSFDAHRQLLSSVESEELGVMRKQSKLHNQLDRHFPSAGVDLEAQQLEEMSAGLFVDDNDDDDDNDGDEVEEEKEKKEQPQLEAGGVAAADDVKERRRVPVSAKASKEARRQQAEARERKRLRRLGHELGQLTSVSKSVDTAEAAKRQRQAARLAKRLLKAKGTKRLGRHKFEEVEQQFKLADELTPTLRQVTPEGDLFVDVVKSLQRRNIIEPSQRAKWKRKYPLKRYKKKNQAGPLELDSAGKPINK